MNEKNKKFDLPRDFGSQHDFSTLTDDEKQLILRKAEDHVVAETKRQQEELFLDVAIRHERRKFKPSEQFIDVLIDLPGHAQRLLIDGVEYSHGYTYRVPMSMARSMWEQMQRCWNHENEIGGANRNWYRSPRNISIGPQHVAVPANRLLGF
jgi:hypothetical protein